MAFQKPIHVSPHLAALLASDTPHNLRLAINRVLIDLDAPVMRQEESLQDVADRVRPLNCIIADCIQGYNATFYPPKTA